MTETTNDERQSCGFHRCTNHPPFHHTMITPPACAAHQADGRLRTTLFIIIIIIIIIIITELKAAHQVDGRLRTTLFAKRDSVWRIRNKR